MARNLNMVVFMTLVVVATMSQSSSGQITHTVGDTLGWTVPPGGEVAYQTWAATRRFAVGDILDFNFTNGAHNVAEVRRAGFDSCSGSAATTTISTSPARITLTVAGEHFYICSFPQHCSLGQKLAINVTRTNAATPPSSPAPTPPSTTTPPPNSGSPTTPSIPTTPSPNTAPPPPDSAAPPSSRVTALLFTLLSIALAFLY